MCYTSSRCCTFKTFFNDCSMLTINVILNCWYRQSTLFTSKTIIDRTKIELQELVYESRKKDKQYKLHLEKLKNRFQSVVVIFSNLQQVLGRDIHYRFKTEVLLFKSLLIVKVSLN